MDLKYFHQQKQPVNPSWQREHAQSKLQPISPKSNICEGPRKVLWCLWVEGPAGGGKPQPKGHAEALGGADAPPGLAWLGYKTFAANAFALSSPFCLFQGVSASQCSSSVLSCSCCPCLGSGGVNPAQGDGMCAAAATARSNTARQEAAV